MSTERFKFRAWNRIVERMQDFDFPDFDRICKTHGIAWQNIVITQWTGLKDKNGADIYEGDIVQDNDRVKQVKWRNQNASFYLSYTEKGKSYYGEFRECGQSQSDGPIHIDTIEIIGNIYQHPHLLTN